MKFVSSSLAVLGLFCATNYASAFTISQPSTSTLTSSTSLHARKSQEYDTNKDNDNAAKKAALEGVLQKIERSYGRGSIVKLGDADNMIVDSISTGALTLGKL